MLELSLPGCGGRVLFSALLALALVACGGSDTDEPNYQFGAADVEQLLLGSWIGTWTGVSGSSAPLALEVSRVPVRRAACGSRELGIGTTEQSPGPAASVQCVSSSDMLLAGSLSVEAMFSALPLTGGVGIPGYQLSEAYLSLRGTGVEVIAQWSRGQWELCRAQDPGGAVTASCTLERAP